MLFLTLTTFVTFLFSLVSATCQFGNDTAFLFLDIETGVLPLLPAGLITTQFVNNTELWLAAVRAVQTGNVTADQPRLPLIVFSQVIFTPGYPELSPQNAFFDKVASELNFTVGSPLANIYAPLAPNIAGGEVVVKKTRFNAALYSPLVQVLYSQNVKSVVLSGTQTKGVILSTATYLSDLDFVVYIVEETVLDPVDIDPTNPNSTLLAFNGTTLSHTILYDVLADFATPISLQNAQAGLC